MLLKAESLALRYPNGALGIEDVTIEIDEGQVVALIGANGAGKTTTCRALSGFLKTEDMKIVRGRVFFDGADVTGREPHRLAKMGISAVPERNKVFPNLSVREHFISAGLHRSRAEREDMLEFGLQLFPGIRERMKQSAGKLSGGEQQMVAIIRALVNHPRLLIVDEMTLGLHASLRVPLFEALRTIAAQGTACFVIDENASHTVTNAEYCYLLEGGRITKHGRSSDFANTDLLDLGYANA
jgi:branched-chain amino acid transport system ATP-binding protein